MILYFVVGFGLVGLLIAAWEWARIVASAYEVFCRWLGVPQDRAPQARSARWSFPRPLLGRGSRLSVKGLRRRKAKVRKDPAPPPNPPSHDLSPPVVDFGRRNYPAVALFAVALEPDFDSFFGGIEAAVAAGGIAVIAVVVVLAIRRFVSF